MQLELVLTLVGVFGFVAIAAGSLSRLAFRRYGAEQTRVRAVIAATPARSLEPMSLSEMPDPALLTLSKAVPRSPKDMGRLRRRLGWAGYYSLRAAVYYALAELTLPIILAAVVFLLRPFGGPLGWFGVVVAAMVGYVIPGLWLRRKTNQRKKTIQDGLPDALDLSIICMEAGSSLEQAIVKAGEELDITHPALAMELRLVTTEVRAGKSRVEAFKNFEKRTAVDDVRTLVTMLVQTDQFGTSVSQALRTHANTSRIKRRQRAEERAGKVGVKLVFPLVFCLFPAVYIVCIGPVVVGIYRALF